ncbi:MAG: fibronectin type III domain-containing protein, partial [Candidatus Peregrinibacteria bacterium]
GLTFSSIGRSQVTVTADGTFPNQGVGSASIEFDNGIGVTQSVTLGADWTNSNLSAGTEYTYTVYAKNGDGDETASAEGVVTTDSGSSAPHDPGDEGNGNGDNGNGQDGNGQITDGRTCTELPGTSQRNRYCFANLQDLFSYLNNLVRVSRMHPGDYLDFNRDGVFDLRDMVEFIRR